MEDLKKSGIYRIINNENGKFYVGSAAGKNGIHQRFQDHRKTLRGNRHCNSYLQKSWNKYGEQLFSFEVLEFCEKDKCIEREQYYLNMLNPQYNICKTAGNTLGVNCEDFMTSDAVIIKRKKQSENISKASKGVPKTNEHAINCGAKHFNVYKAIIVQHRQPGVPSIYEKGEFVGKWLKRGDCSKALNISEKYISRCLKKKRTQSHGFIFEHEAT